VSHFSAFVLLMALTGPAFVASAAPSVQTVKVPHIDAIVTGSPGHKAYRRHDTKYAICAAFSAAALLCASQRTTRRRLGTATATVARRAESKETPEAPRNFFEVNRRAAVALPTAAVVSGVGGSAARAEYEMLSLKKSDTECTECDSTGLVGCQMCEGTGQFRTWGTDMERMPVKQYVTCPECNGVGETVCQKCAGTGLPAKRLKGLMRDPIFAKVAFRLKRQRVDVNTVDKMKADVKKAVDAAERRAAEKNGEV